MHDHEGFTSVTPLSAARDRLRERCEAGTSETVQVAAAAGRVLAEPVRATRDVPHYDRAAMDGYAVRAADTVEATERSPAYLATATGGVGAGEAVQVHTGSALPEGADAVVVVERTETRDDEVAVFEAVPPGENVAPAGEDVEADRALFDAGRRLSPADLALLRASGTTTVEAYRTPRVAVIPTGEELVEADPAPGEVVETNGLMVSRLAEGWGATASYRDVVTDERAALGTAVEAGADHDLVVTTGGSSVGERDLVADVVGARGEILVHGVALKPGHPVGIGAVAGTPVLLLPGYPVSCLVTAVQLLRPALAWLAGTTPPPHPVTRARLSRKLPSEPGVRSFARVRLDGSGGTKPPEDSDSAELPGAEPLRVGGAGVLSSAAFADGWVTVPESREGIPAGEVVGVEDWRRCQ
ncbi:MAG: gephyrin-like molybdotransferase Glp [Salinirussus sp.]